MIPRFEFRELVALVLLGYFGWAFYQNPDNETIIGALLMAFAGAWGFYLGGSKVGSDTAEKNADTVAAQAQGATNNAANAEGDGKTLDVNVTNTKSDPVPTTPGDKP